MFTKFSSAVGTSHTSSLIAHSYTAILYIKPSRWVQAVVFGDVVITIWCYCITMKCWCIVGFMKTDFYGVYLFCAVLAASEQLADLPLVVVFVFLFFFTFRYLYRPFKAHGYLRLLNSSGPVKVSAFFFNNLIYLLVYTL